MRIVSPGKMLLWDLVTIGLAVAAVAAVPHLVSGEPVGLLTVVHAWQGDTNNVSDGIVLGTVSPFLLLLLGLTTNPHRAKDDDYGKAEWATAAEARKAGLLADTGVILGRYGRQFVRVDSRSVMVVAPPGTGKTAGIAIPTLLSTGKSTVAVDVKGELYDTTSARRAGFSDVVRFAPAMKDSARWNPLAATELPEEWDDRVETVERISTVIFPVPERGDPHWEKEARSMFMFFALYLLHRDGETSLPEVRRLGQHDIEIQEWIEDTVETESDELPERVLEEGRSLAQKADKEFSGVFSSWRAGMQVFASPAVARATDGCDFSVRDFRKQPTSLYLCVQERDLDRFGPLLRIFLESLSNELLSADRAPDEQEVVIVADEFVRLGRMDKLVDLPGLGRSYGVQVVFICQDYAQIEAKYEPQGRKKLVGTCSYQVIYQLNDADTAEAVSKAIGDRTRKRESKSGQFGKAKSKSESMEGVRLIRAQELLSLEQGEVLVVAQGARQRPVRGHWAAWFKDPVMRRLVGRLETSREAA